VSGSSSILYHFVEGCMELKLMLDALFIKKFFNLGVLEFGPIVTSYFLIGKTKLFLCTSNKDLHLLLYLALIIKKEYPSEAGIIINNY
jgi:hypothetical protein